MVCDLRFRHASGSWERRRVVVRRGICDGRSTGSGVWDQVLNALRDSIGTPDTNPSTYYTIKRKPRP
ncbi:conserved hypothetical protein [Streptomyces sviceus ATCC 29083]|uniref:Uncharacterized protein n=1 Tax=Streptomyces sviceus (strain ATCC 29083 / DSM 924 / JCM 4929 / NBRC 13980 / NCIMB 11184 / NRRL 5439 / UC 5370) TaxID=463191 RepID=B5I495_STRX2|nr:conserved hypothetical protein [Streptomyces sviceus ATCC 29083]